jgi:hypothetical protein
MFFSEEGYNLVCGFPSFDCFDKDRPETGGFGSLNGGLVNHRSAACR